MSISSSFLSIGAMIDVSKSCARLKPFFLMSCRIASNGGRRASDRLHLAASSFTLCLGIPAMKILCRTTLNVSESSTSEHPPSTLSLIRMSKKSTSFVT